MSGRAVRYGGWAVTLAAAAVYLYMLMASLPHLAALAGGAPMFDLRSGYDLDTARALLTSLGSDGRAYYATVQHALDSFYPPLLTLAVIYWTWRFSIRWRNRGWPLPQALVLVLFGIAMLAGGMDLTENAMVGTMLDAGPDGLTAEMVARASGFTLAKVVAVTVSQTALLVLIAGSFIRRPGATKG